MDRWSDRMDGFALEGTPTEMGRQFAERLSASDRSLASISPESLDPPEAKRAFARECVPAVEEHVPELLAEIDAFADDISVDRETARLVPLALDADVGCSLVGIAGVHTSSGDPLFGRNLDFHPSTRRFAKLFSTRPADGLASVGCALAFVGRLDGINEAGLAVGFAGVPTEAYVPGISWPLAIRHVLDTCERVGEATAFLESIPHVRNVNFLVADAAGDVAGATGDVAVVEAGPEAVATTRPDDGFVAATNQFASTRMREYQSVAHQPEARVPADCPRYRTLTEWFEDRRGDIGLDDLQTATGDPDAGACWRIDDEDDDPRSTIWSWTAALGEGVAHLARDSPVETPYRPVEVPGRGD